MVTPDVCMCRPIRGRPASDHGSAGLIPLIGGLGVAAATVVAGALVAGSLVHSRAEAAADMVALAAAGRILTDPDPCGVAARVADDNDVVLSRCDVAGVSVTVTVAADLPPVLRPVAGGRQAHASARAELVPDPDVISPP